MRTQIVGRIHESIIENSNLKILMMAIAVDDVGSIDILDNGDEFITICEEYAKIGICVLNDLIGEVDDIWEYLEYMILEYSNM